MNNDPAMEGVAEASARSVFVAWEILRLWFNAIMSAIVVYVGWGHLGLPDFWFFVALNAVAANVCFCVGPVAEGYLDLMIDDRQISRALVFFHGLLLAGVLTWGMVLTWGWNWS